MLTIFKCLYGSNLFGVATPESDTDIKGVYVADFDELVNGQTDARSDNNGKEGKDKIEREFHYIRTFAHMIKQGQTIAYSLLFAPEDYWLQASQEWCELVANRDLLVSKRVEPFVGYARSQAVKYSLKGERLRTLGDFIRTISSCHAFIAPNDTFGRFNPAQFELLQTQFGGREGVRLWTEETAGGPVRHIEVCGKSFGETTPVKLWLGPLEAMLKRYGKRAMAAKESEGSDLKAMYHAVRLTSEMNELLRTGHITYPRPDAELLMAIRQGKFTNGEVAEMIDAAVAEGDKLMLTTTLRENADAEWLDRWVLKTQAHYVGVKYV
jgi:hypothetical protein